MLNHTEVKQILQSIPDRAQRQQIEAIITNDIQYRVRCESCSRIVAEIHKNGKITPLIGKDGTMYLLAYRHRLDSNLGFQCLCGNDSRLSPQEKGNKGIEGNSATKSDIEAVLRKVKQSPSNYNESGGVKRIDNFTLIQV